MQRNNKPARIIKGTAKQPTLKDASGVWTLDEAMQAHRANSWPQPNLFQPISNSLRFKNNVSYVTRQVTRQGNQRTFTTSLWVKRDSIGTRDALFNTCNVSGNAYWGFEFGSDDRLYVYDNFSSNLVTTQVFRDVNAWYHIIVAVDTTQATSSNRTKVYVNGVQITSFSSAGYPAQNLATRMNGIDVPNQAIGSWFPSVGAFQYGGYITEVNFVDGYQLVPALFGKFDTNNTWTPIAYTGTYGTNGFYLPFTNTTTSQTLGYDASLNGTPTYDVDQDPYRGSVSLHLTGNGPVGGNNNTFADSSPNNLIITRNGDATQGSFSPSSMRANSSYNPAINGASVYFDGSGDYLNTTSSQLDLTGVNFTIEAWVYLDFSNNGQTLINFQPHATIGISLNRTGIGDTYVYIGNGSSWLGSPAINSNSASNNLTANTWNHVALVSNGSTVTLYHNGVSAGSSSTMPSGFNGGAYIGSIWTSGPGEYFKGYKSNFRIVREAIYTAAFTPTNRPFGTLTNNLLTFSENFTSPWWAANTSNTEGTAIAPDGTPSATTLVAGTYPAAAGVGSSTVAVTGSIYAKSNVGTQLTFRLNRWGSGADYVEVIFNLTTGTATGATTAGTASGLATSIVNVGNGWWRCIISGTTSTTGGAISFNPNPTNGSIFIWGAQLETGGTATNYTPTPANFSTAPTLLLNFANAAVVDSAGANNIRTVGSSTITSSSKYGSGALAVSSNNYFSCPGSLGNTSFGTGDFTVEFWWKSNGSQSNYTSIISQGFTGSPPSGAWGLKVTGGSQTLQFTYSSSLVNVEQNINSSIQPNDSAWHHIAVSRSYSKLYMFIDGRLVGNFSIPSTEVVGNTTSDIRIGYNERDNTYANGTIDDLRVTKGVARYQDSFTPPARGLPEVGGDSFVTVNVNAGVVQRFTTVGSTSWTAPVDVTQVEVLVVAGGGGGGLGLSTRFQGGGGAGGLIYNNQYPVTPGQTYTVTVGAGGVAQSTSYSPGNDGANSQFGNLIAYKGQGYASTSGAGSTYGSSSGGGWGGAGSTPTLGSYTPTPGQGFAGGTSVNADSGSSGGGGGAGGTGGNGVSGAGGAGGPGLQFGISGTPTYYAGGGGGTGATSAGSGGIGGGGAGVLASAGVAGTANTGGGGGSSNTGASGGAGGSGIVIVRYTTTAVGNTSDATTDNLVDSPTLYGHDTGAGGEVVGNYCTLNPIDTETEHSFSNGNLTLFKAASNWSSVRSTMAFSSGKWYFETTYNASWDYAHVGVLDVTVDTYTGQVANSGYVGKYANGWAYQQDQRVWNNDTNIGGSLGAVRAYAGDIAMVAVDMDAGKIWFGVNGVWFGSGVPATGANAAYSNLSGTVSPAFSVYGNSSGITVNFGQRAWAYTPPQGFNAITTKNLPRPAVGSAAATPNEYFKPVAYTAAGTVQAINAGFTPDLVWIKGRNNLFTPNAMSSGIYDTVRGGGISLSSEATSVEYNYATHPSGDLAMDFTATGFTTPPVVNNNINYSGANYVAWMWKANGAAVSNTSGTIASQVSANTTSGFSIVTWTGVGSSQSVGHGLGATPKLIIFKSRNQTGDWYVYTTAIDGTNKYLRLNATSSALTAGPAVPTSSVFYSDTFSSANNMIAYCWAEVEGFSKIGTYTGNGSADGTFVYTGFKPAFLLAKRYDAGSSENWFIVDSSRNTFNPANSWLSPSLINDEGTDVLADLLSNGFKLRSTAINANAGTYIYMAFAEKPFGNVNGTAR